MSVPSCSSPFYGAVGHCYIRQVCPDVPALQNKTNGYFICPSVQLDLILDFSEGHGCSDVTQITHQLAA